MEEEPDGTDDGGDQLPPLPAAPAPVSGDVEEVRREAKVVITAIKRQPSASLAVHTDLQGALRSVDLKLPEAFRASSRGASTLAREANARWSTVLTRVQVSRYARTLPAIRRVGADGGGRRGPLTKEAFDTAADELLRTMKSSSEVYAGQQAQTAQVTRLPVIEAAAPARKPRRADRRPAKRRLASSGSDRGRASSLVSAGEVAEARGGYSQSAVRQEVRQKLAALRSDPEARERFYEEISEMIAARQGDQDSFIQHNIVAVSDGSVSPRARHLRLQELAQRRDEKIRIAKLRKEAVDHEQRERLEAELSRLSKLRERRIQRELEDEKQRAVLRWMTVYAYVTALGRLGVTLRRERRLREKHRAARVLQRELRSFTRRSYMRRLTRAINTIQKFTWRMLLAHHVRVKRRSTWIVRKWLAATGAAGIPSRVIRNFRFAVVKIQMFFRSMAIVRNAQLTLLGERWRHVLNQMAAEEGGDAPLIPDEVRDDILLADLFERKTTYAVQLREWFPAYKEHEHAREALQHFAQTHAERTELRQELDRMSRTSMPSSMRSSVRAKAAKVAARRGTEESAGTEAEGLSEDEVLAVTRVQRVVRGRLARNFLLKHRPSQPLPPRPRFRVLLPEEYMRKLIKRAELRAKMGAVPYRVKMVNRTKTAAPGELDAAAGAARDAATAPGADVRAAETHEPTQPPVQ